MRILLATDGSGHSDAALDEITHRCDPRGIEVRIISVVAPFVPPTYTLGDSVDVELYDQIERNARERARAAVEKAAARLQADAVGRPLHVTTDVLSGSPKRVILEEGEAFGADLIVVGSHGQGMLERFLLGSVSQAVALHARCSVEIVRTSEPRASEATRQ